MHIYVGVCCLSSRYLAWCISSHAIVRKFAEHILYAPSFICVHNGVCVRYLCVWIGPLCVISDLNFMAGWASSAAAAWFWDYPELHRPQWNHSSTGVQLTSSFLGFTHKHKVMTTQARLHLHSHTQWKKSVFWQHKITQNTKMRHLRAAKMFTLENEAVRAETQCSTGRPWLGHYWSIQSSQSDAFLQTTIYSLRTNVTAAPPLPECLMAVSFSLARWVCSMAHVIEFDSVNKGSR